jgi:ABC-type transport system involved in multi-copper enzyme maturation permease subunit
MPPEVFTAVLGTLFSEIFDTNVRYTGVSLGYQLGVALAGGTAPFFATALMNGFHNSWIPAAIYIMFTGVISIISIFSVKEKKTMILCREIPKP